MKLSKRLQTIAAFVRPHSRIADVGTDHAYIPIHLVLKGVADRAIAMDVRMGPLQRAQNHVRNFNLEEKITTRLSDGLAALNPGESDTVIIAGLGGELLIDIMEGGKDLWPEITSWVLSPQSEIHKVRRFLSQNGFMIRAETMLLEDGKYYTVMDVVRGQMIQMREIDYFYGKSLMIANHLVLKEYLQKERQKVERVLAQMQSKAGVRYQELLTQLQRIKEAEDEMQRNNYSN